MTGPDLRVIGQTQIVQPQIGTLHVVVVDGLNPTFILGMDNLKGSMLDYENDKLLYEEAVFTLGPMPPVMRRGPVEKCV